MATEQRAQRIAGGFAAPADFAALHADRIEAVCRMQAAEGRELTRVWEIGHELKEVRSLAQTTRPILGPDPDPGPRPSASPLSCSWTKPRSDPSGAALGARGPGGGAEEVRRDGGADGAAA